MSGYLSFYKDEEVTCHLFTISRTNKTVAYIIDNVSNFTIEGNVVPLPEEALEVIFNDIEQDISEQKQIMALMLIKRDYELHNMIEYIETYEALLKAFGMLRVISKMISDNEHVLYLTYG
jgi:hypothetical protein